MPRANYIHLFLLSWLLFLSGATANAQIITKIEIEGLKKTKESYLRPFLTSKIGEELDLNKVKRDAQQLLNLEAIADVRWEVDTVDAEVNLHFHIKEALTFFPIINFGGVRGNFWYQLGFTDANWGGKGIKLSTFYMNNDGRHNFNFQYRNQFLKGNKWGGSFSFVQWASIEPLFFSEGKVFYDYNNTSIGGTIIRHFPKRQALELGATYFVEAYQKNNRHEGTVTPGPQSERLPKFLNKFIYQIDHINYNQHLRSGFANVLNFQTVYTFADKSLFYILINETRFFKEVGKQGNLAARLRLGLSTNNDSPFAPFVLDSYVNIRGSGNRIDRGTAAIILNLEYRHTLFNTASFTGQAVAFSDSGTWRKPGGSLRELWKGEDLRQFVGLGSSLRIQTGAQCYLKNRLWYRY